MGDWLLWEPAPWNNDCDCVLWYGKHICQRLTEEDSNHLPIPCPAPFVAEAKRINALSIVAGYGAIDFLNFWTPAFIHKGQLGLHGQYIVGHEWEIKNSF